MIHSKGSTSKWFLIQPDDVLLSALEGLTTLVVGLEYQLALTTGLVLHVNSIHSVSNTTRATDNADDRITRYKSSTPLANWTEQLILKDFPHCLAGVTGNPTLDCLGETTSRPP
jgi:hypothetical protein